MQVCPGAQLQQRRSMGEAGGEYVQFTVPSPFGQDVMEFLILGCGVHCSCGSHACPLQACPLHACHCMLVHCAATREPVKGRQWQGDVNAGLTVLYRSQAGSVKYIWPLTLPLTDGGAQRKRLDAIRQQLDWRLVGCELVECYQ